MYTPGKEASNEYGVINWLSAEYL